MKKVILILLQFLLLTHLIYAQNILILPALDDAISDLSSKVLETAYHKIGIKLKFEEYPAERALRMSNSGHIDGEVNRIKGIDKTYTNLILIPISVNSFEGMAFSHNVQFEVNGWESLRPYSIAIRIGIKFAEIGTEGMNVIKFPTNKKVFQMVAYGRVDICISSRLTGLYTIKKYGFKNIKILEPPLIKLNLYHYLHKKNKHLVPKITQSLKQMQDNGSILKIRRDFINRLKIYD